MRRFYGFNSAECLSQHVAQVATLSDLMQLKYDIQLSGTNLSYFKEGIPGVYEVYFVSESPKGHLFLTKAAKDKLGELTEEKKRRFATITIFE